MNQKRRASSAEEARRYRQAGHDDALRFALLIGMDKDYKRDPAAKKDVIDPSGDAHSVKSGEKKWQIFLYRRNRFIEDDGFQALNGIGALLIHCIDAFPPRYEDYADNKDAAKERLKVPMRELKDRFQRKALLRAFLRKSIFNGGEVDYLTAKEGGRFHVFWCDDVVQAMAESFAVRNSVARTGEQFDDQKVLFCHQERNVGELEMRNDSAQHYGEVRFTIHKPPCMALLLGAGLPASDFSPEVRLHGKACRTFGKWRNAR